MTEIFCDLHFVFPVSCEASEMMAESPWQGWTRGEGGQGGPVVVAVPGAPYPVLVKADGGEGRARGRPLHGN